MDPGEGWQAQHMSEELQNMLTKLWGHRERMPGGSE